MLFRLLYVLHGPCWVQESIIAFVICSLPFTYTGRFTYFSLSAFGLFQLILTHGILLNQPAY